MSLKQWEKKVLQTPGAEERVRAIEDELRLASGLTALREEAGVSQRELADRVRQDLQHHFGGAAQARALRRDDQRAIDQDGVSHHGIDELIISK